VLLVVRNDWSPIVIDGVGTAVGIERHGGVGMERCERAVVLQIGVCKGVSVVNAGRGLQVMFVAHVGLWKGGLM
jgi:hypothetical protein